MGQRQGEYMKLAETIRELAQQGELPENEAQVTALAKQCRVKPETVQQAVNSWLEYWTGRGWIKAAIDCGYEPAALANISIRRGWNDG